MGLLSTASAANRVTERELAVTYSVSAVRGSWSWTVLNVTYTITVAYEYRRHATCAYRYVGMDYASAKAAADEVRSKYTRAFWTSGWGSGGDFETANTGTKLQGSVEVVQRAGHLYDVVVEVNEDDFRLRKSPGLNPDAVFANENARVYDY